MISLGQKRDFRPVPKTSVRLLRKHRVSYRINVFKRSSCMFLRDAGTALANQNLSYLATKDKEQLLARYK